MKKLLGKSLAAAVALVAALQVGAAAISSWEELKNLFASGGTGSLVADCQAPADGDVTLQLNNSVSVSLDLAGHTITGTGCDTIVEIWGSGFLTLSNSVPGIGAITGGGYRCISVWDGRFVMDGGAVCGNYSPNDGGGVYVGEGGEFVMNGGVISNNTASASGGGVYVEWGASFTMNGGTISDNVAACAGGVYVENLMSVSGSAVVSGNTNLWGAASNVFLDHAPLSVAGLSEGASIGVTANPETIAPTENNPVRIASGAAAGDWVRFSSDYVGLTVEGGDGEVRLALGKTYPAYLAGADDLAKAKYDSWAASNGTDNGGVHEPEFLLNLRRGAIAPGFDALKVTKFDLTSTGRRFELASDVCALFKPAGSVGGIYLNNGVLLVKTGSAPSKLSSVTSPLPSTVDATTGRAVVELRYADYPDESATSLPRLFRPFLVPFAEQVGVTGPEGGYAPAEYRLVWSDEFNSGASPSAEWKYDVGGDGWGNGELQYYCDGGVYGATGQRTASVGDGTLKIKAYQIDNASDFANKFVSARFKTKKSWKHGYVEMRAKLPVTAGCWPAFWMLPEGDYDWNGRTNGEIDILEYVPGEELNTVYFSAHSYNATPVADQETHTQTGYVGPDDHVKYSYCQSGQVDTPGEWHCYGMKWTHEGIWGYIDGVQFFYVPNPVPDNPGDMDTWPFDQPFYIILNLAVGGWGGTPEEPFGEPTFEVDWVRVYQK